jgi:hypothetical protein
MARKLVAHGIQRQRDAAGLGLEQVAVGRLPGAGVLGRREARAFEEVHHAGRDQGEFLAGLARRRLVLAAHLGMQLEIVLAVPAHEREVQCPPGQAHDRHPLQLILDEELEQRDAPVEQVLQDEDVHPALVVAVHQVPVLRIEPGDMPSTSQAVRCVSAIQPLLPEIQVSAIFTSSGSISQAHDA